MVDIANHSALSLVKAEDIAVRQRTSSVYMGHVLNELKRGGLIDSVRGRNGGYCLSRPPGEINVADIILVMEKGLQIVDCFEDGTHCKREEKCLEKKLWNDARRKLLKYFEMFSLEKLGELKKSKPMVS